MYKINQVILPVDYNKSDFVGYVSRAIKVDPSIISDVKLKKLSIDARDKNNLCYKASFVFDTTTKLNLKKLKSVEPFVPYDFSVKPWKKSDKIVIVGSGPSGLFCALRLVESGAKVTVLERGYEMSKRKKAVENLRAFGVLDPISNIQFGEGGAGTFSDGKLNTGIKSKYIEYVLETFAKFGAGDKILYEARPHIGTDVLSDVIVNIRKYLESKGSKVLFEHKFESANYDGDTLKSINVSTPNGDIKIECDKLVLAIGHSSRDTVMALFDRNLQFRQKPFSLGYRIEHLQSSINKAQFGESKNASLLPPADYHLVEHLKSGRVVYTFCMCPGGEVVPAMSEVGTVVTNGMSGSARDGMNANSAILVGVNTSDFGGDHPLAGMFLQETLEKKAYEKAGGYCAIVQRVGDFLAGKPTTELGSVTPTFKPKYKLGSVEDLLPTFIVKSLKEGIVLLGKKLKGFDNPDVILTGIETRSSAPFQVVRDDTMQSSLNGIYCIGEGAGFAGGIVSSAVEGIKCADILID